MPRSRNSQGLSKSWKHSTWRTIWPLSATVNRRSLSLADTDRLSTPNARPTARAGDPASSKRMLQATKLHRAPSPTATCRVGNDMIGLRCSRHSLSSLTLRLVTRPWRSTASESGGSTNSIDAFTTEKQQRCSRKLTVLKGSSDIGIYESSNWDEPHSRLRIPRRDRSSMCEPICP